MLKEKPGFNCRITGSWHQRKDVTPDGTLKNILRLEYGYWESKDESLKLDRGN
ncbi:MAG: hypothetical protein R2759_07730 [Bacteroidales bacterium]